MEPTYKQNEKQNEKPKNKYIGLKIGGEAHMTLVFLGIPSMENLILIENDLKVMKEKINNIINEGKFELKFLDEWKTFGNTEDIAAGLGVRVRKCKLLNNEIQTIFLEFYKKYYFHAEGEAEERKLGPQYHVTVGKISREQLEQMDIVNLSVNDIFLK